MIRLIKKNYKILVVFLLPCLFVNLAQAQDAPNFVDIGVRFVSPPPAAVKINQVFGVQAEVYLDSNTTTIPAGETVTADVTLVDPDGIVIQSHTQNWNGFNEDTDGNIANQNGQILLQVPWSQANKWTGTATWKVILRVTATSVESDMADNIAQQTFSVLMPDLELTLGEVTATDPLTGDKTTNFVPNTNYSVTGTITNIGQVMTQPAVRTSVVAQLRRLTLGEDGSHSFGEVIDEEAVLFPATAQTLDYLMPETSWNFTINNLFLDANATGLFGVTVEVNPSDIPGGRIMREADYTNNLKFEPSNGIDVSPGDENATSFPDLEYVENSYNGEKGNFRGLDPAFISFAIRNNGTRPVTIDDNISAKVLLSKDQLADDSDFILREFNLGGDGIGFGMLAGETINLTWFQQLPDNYEGDYYLILEINNRGTVDPAIPLDTTPIFSLSSQGKGRTDLLSLGNTADSVSERPSISKDGSIIVYEQTDNNGIQQIYMIDRKQALLQPILISKSYQSTSNQDIEGNNNSYRPMVSADGKKVTFHSRASNLVVGDTNEKEDVFLYDLALNTMVRPLNANNEQLNGRSLYPTINGDGTKIVFESDSSNTGESLNPFSQIFLWTIDSSGSSSLASLSNGDGNSYNPSIDEAGNRVVFDTYATNLLDDPSKNGTIGGISSDDNDLRDVYLIDLEADKIYLASLNYLFEQTTGGASMNPRISGDGSRIVFESKAQNLVSGAGIAKVVITEGGVGYAGSPTFEIFDAEGDFNASGGPGSGAVVTLQDDAINELTELKKNAVLVIDSGEGYVNPQVQIIPDPRYPEPIFSAKATAYLSNPDGDVYYVNVADLNGTTLNENPEKLLVAQRVSQSITTKTGGNFGSREPSINYDGSKIVYSTKSSNLLPDSITRDDGMKFYNSTFELPTVSPILVGSIYEIEISDPGSGYIGGFLNIEDLSGTGSGAEASYEVDQRGRIVSIQIINSGQNYQLDKTVVSVAEPLGGSGFIAGDLRFEPTKGLGEDRSGGGRIFKVQMNDYGLGYKIGEAQQSSFADLIQFEGDGADLNGDGFPDGRINPDRVHNVDGSLYIEQRFQVEVLSGTSGLVGSDILNTTLTISDNNNSLDPLIIEFEEGAGSTATTIPVTLGVTTKSALRDAVVDLIDDYMSISASGNVTSGPLIENNQTNGSTFVFAALSGRLSTNNPSAVRVVEESNMLIMGSGYTTVTPVVNQVPSIFGLSETKSDPEFSITSGMGRMTLLASEDIESDDIYLYDEVAQSNTRVSVSSFGTPAGYLPSDPNLPSPPSSRFPAISGNGRFIIFSSDVWGNGGLAFDRSNQEPLVSSATRNIYLKDLKSTTDQPSSSSLDLLFPPTSETFEFAPQSKIPVVADFDYNGEFELSVYLNRKRLDNTEIDVNRFGGGDSSSYNTQRFTAFLDPARIKDLNNSGEFTLELVAFGEGNSTIAVSQTARFVVKQFSGSLPPRIKISTPKDAVTSTSTLPINAFADDPDGAIKEVKFYANGKEIFVNDQNHTSLPRTPGVTEETMIYGSLLKIDDLINDGNYSLEDRGIISLFAVAIDQSNNHVASGVFNLSYTQGSSNLPTSQILLNGDPADDNTTNNIDYKELTRGSDYNLTISSSSGGIDGIIFDPGLELIGAKDYRLDIFSRNGGSGANFIIEASATGSLTAIQVLPGSGYSDDDNTSLRIIPVYRAYNEGRQAKLESDNNGNIVIVESPDGTIEVGNGYSIYPRARPLPSNDFADSDSEIVPLEPVAPDIISSTISTTFSIPAQFVRSSIYDVYGGFTQSPMVIKVSVTQTSEAIESVSLVIDGSYVDELIKYQPDHDKNGTTSEYYFSWVPEVAKDYMVSAVVQDVAGNIQSTEPKIITVANYKAGGIRLSHVGDDNFSAESDDSVLLSVNVESQYDIEQVDFFIDDRWVGSGENKGGSNFQKGVRLKDFEFRPGEYEVSYRAIDTEGNMAGTFSPFLTSINYRKNKTLIITPPSSPPDGNITLVSPIDDLTLPEGSTIRVLAMASDNSGDLTGVHLYSSQDDDNPLYAWRQVLDFNGSLPTDERLLTVEDGTGKSVTFEFDDNASASISTIIPEVVPSAPNLLNDFSISSTTFSNSSEISFLVEIDGVGNASSGTVDSYRYSIDGGRTFAGEKITINAGASVSLPRGFGVQVMFENSLGHALGDSWSFILRPLYQIVKIEDDHPSPEVNRLITRNNLLDAMNEAENMGLLSIHASVQDDPDLIYLRHLNDLLYANASLSGSSLESNGTGGNIVLHYNQNDSSSDNSSSLLIPQFADSKKSQPFGITWQANFDGNQSSLDKDGNEQIYFYAIAKDNTGQETISKSTRITIVPKIGSLPVIELGPVEESMVYSGSVLSAPLSAEANDPDGAIAEVIFYANGLPFGSDSTRPYSASFEINATGHYEVYAVARDNSGNLVTSNVRRIVVDEGGEEPEQPLVLSASTAYLGGVGEISGTYKSQSGSYDSNIRALVYIDGSYAGDADLLPRTPPAPGEEDPGQSFTYDLPTRNLGGYEVEFIIIDGGLTASTVLQLEVKASPLSDDYEFLKALWNGLFDRDPESAEINAYLARLSNGSMTRPQVIGHIRTQQEFINSRDVLLTHKTLHGVWEKLPIVLENTDQQGYSSMGGGGNSAASQAAMGMPYVPDQNNTLGFYEGVEDDVGNVTPLGKWISMNEPPFMSVISYTADEDVFQIRSNNLQNEGQLTITVNKTVNGFPTITGWTSPLGVHFTDGTYTTIIDIEQKTGTAGDWSRHTLTRTFDLSGFKNVNYYSISFIGARNGVEVLGGYTISTTNPAYLNQLNFLTDEEIAQLQIDSRVNNFDLTQSLTYQTNNFLYTDQYGQIGTHNPEEFFTRLFRNKYEQDPSPVQIARGVELLTDADGNNSQLEFLENFALENKIITVGGYNYTSGYGLHIPNVPLDAAAFAETALVYSALIGEAPTRAEVAKITLTPDYQLRPMTERARMIMEMPAYAARYGMAMPEVDFVGAQNGRAYDASEVQEIYVDATSLGPDNLANTNDDGRLISVELFLNGLSVGKESSINGTFFYEFTLAADSIASGEYRMEVVAEDANGLISRAERTISFIRSTDASIKLTSPKIGEVLEAGSLLEFSFESNQSLTQTYLEVDGQVRWIGAVAFNGVGLPEDESNITILDGTGRESVTFEFDDNSSASSTTIYPAELMVGSGAVSVSSGGSYLGTDRREYFIEIDGIASGPTGGDTFRWSIDGGAHFNDQQVEIVAGTNQNLSAGVMVNFSASTGNQHGDQWRIKAEPDHYIVEVGRYGTFEERLHQTKRNLIHAINQTGNLSMHEIHAEEASSSGTWMNLATTPRNMIADHAILLDNFDSFYPVVEPIEVSASSQTDPKDTFITHEDILPLAKSNASTQGSLTFRHQSYQHFGRSDVVRTRLVGYDSSGNASYSIPLYFKLMDLDNPRATMLYPNGRPATLRIDSVSDSGDVLEVRVMDGGQGYFNTEAVEFTIHSQTGGGALLSANFDANGSITDVEVLDGGGGYEVFDGISVTAPFRYEPGESIALSASVHDPYGETSGIQFNVNGVPIDEVVDENDTTPNSFYWQSTYTPQYLTPLFFSVDWKDNAGNWHRDGFEGWEPSWILQHFHKGGSSLPQWYWGDTQYWQYPAPWQNMPVPPGGVVSEPLYTTELTIETPNADFLEDQEFRVGSVISLLVDSEILGENVSTITLLANGRAVGEATNLFAEFNGSYLNYRSHLHEALWEPKQAGTYQMQWMATDKSGRISGLSAPVVMTVANVVVGGSAPPSVQLMNPQNLDFLTTSSSVFLTARASDSDFDLKEVQFFVNGVAIGDPVPTPVSGFADLFPYFQRWEPTQIGLHFIHAIATDWAGNTQASPAVSVIVGARSGIAPKPSYQGIVQVAELDVDVNSSAGDGRLSLNVSNPGLGYISPPQIFIDNFGTNGSGLNINITQDLIDPATGELTGLNIVSPGSGYTSPPKIRIEGGFPEIDASGSPGTARAASFTPTTTPDDQGHARAPSGLGTIDVVSRGSGYLQAPDVMISHPTAEGAEAVATMRPAANGRGLEIDSISVTLQGGGRPIEFDANGTNPTKWAPGYDGRTSVTLVGGIPFDEATFEFAEPVFTDPNSTLRTMHFYAVGNNNHMALSSLSDNPFRWNWGSPQPGVYGLYAEIEDTRGNRFASEPIFRHIRPASLPEGDFTSPYRARADAVVGSGGTITDIKLTSPGAIYNLPPRVVIEGDGTGAMATTTIDFATGQVTGVNIISAGSGYNAATTKIRFEEGWVTTQQVDEYVLGETIAIGLTAFANSAEIREIRLIVNNIERDEISFPPLTSDPDYGGYEESTQEFGDDTGQSAADANIQRLDRWKYDGTMPNYNIYFTPSDLGIYNLEAKIIDHTGYSTITSSYRVRVSNGEPPVIELVTPRTGQSFALDYDRNQDIRLVAKAQDPDWQARFGADEQMLDRRNELSRVWFFADDQFVGVGNRILGTDLYQFVWRPTIAKTYRVTAIAVDDQVGDVNMEFGDIGRVGGTGTSDPQYITITDRSGSRPPDVYFLHPTSPKLAPGFLNTELASNDTINLQPDDDPQLLANIYDEESFLAAEYPNLYTSGSRDMLWVWADDRDGDLESTQFFVNGANAVIQIRETPSALDDLNLTINGTQIDYDFNDTWTTTENADALLDVLKTYEDVLGFHAYLMPGAATKYEKSTVLINFDHSFLASMSSTNMDQIFTWVFHEIPLEPGEYMGAHAVIHLRENPSSDLNLTVSLGGINETIELNASNTGIDVVDTTNNLLSMLLGLGLDAELLPQSTTTYEQSNILIRFEASASDQLKSTNENELSATLFGTPHLINGHPSPLRLDGYGGTYFAHPFVPGLNGIFSVHAVVSDTSENRVMSPSAFYKSTLGNPEGTGEVLFTNGTADQTMVSLGASFGLFAQAESNFTIEYVEFFDNGRSFGTPPSRVDEYGVYHPGRNVEFEDSPYMVNWSATELGEHLLYARFTDVKGNSFISEPIKVIVDEGLSVVIAQNSPALTGALYHMQSTKVDVEVQVDSGILPELSEASLFGNNILLKKVKFIRQNIPSVEPITPNDQAEIDQGSLLVIKYDYYPVSDKFSWSFDWNVTYKEFVDAPHLFGHAMVDLRVVALTKGNEEMMLGSRQLVSNVKTAQIVELDYNNPISALALYYKELTGETISTRELIELTSSLSENTSEEDILKRTIDYTYGGEFDYMGDILGAHKVLYGEYYPVSEYDNFFSDYEDWKNNLLGFVTNQLTSNAYITKYGTIFTDRAQFFGNIEGDYFVNRKQFVSRHFINKFGILPTINQYTSGAKKLWNARQADLNDNVTPAAEFIYNLVIEPTSSFGLNGSITETYLPFMKSTRADYIDTAKQFVLLKFGQREDTDADFQLKNSFNEALEGVLNDQSFKNNFNLLWDDSPVSNVSSSWKNEEWFGWFTDETFPWIYHADLGWLYSTSNSQNSIWFFSEELGWFWTNEDVFKDHSNLTDDQRFIYRVRPTSHGGWEGSWSLITLQTAGSGSSDILLYDYGYYPLP